MRSGENIFSLDQSHPNYVRWRRAIDAAVIRGTLVGNILSQHLSLENKKALDVGCGVGGTTQALKLFGSHVTAIDLNPKRIAYLRDRYKPAIGSAADASHLPLRDEEFDVIILQDVIEHTSAHDQILSEISRVLKKDGFVYLSTPNRSSLLNFFADPHWGLPVISLLPRYIVGFIIHLLLRREHEREDFAALLSLRALKSLLQSHGFSFSFQHTFITRQLFEKPTSVVWSDAHLTAIRMIKKMRLQKLFTRIANDKLGFFNRFINPTWYIVAKKLSR